MPIPTRALKDFLPLVTPLAIGCPDPVAIQNLRLAAIEWCERTRAWRHITEQAIVTNDDAIVAPSYATIHVIETASFDGQPLIPTQFSSIDETTRAATDGEFGPPIYITQTSPNQVAVIPFKTGTLDLTLFLKPRSGSEFGGVTPGVQLQDTQNVVPEYIFVQSAEIIAFGALSRLLLIKDQPFTDPKLAGFYLARFEAACNNAFTQGIKGQQQARVRTKLNMF